MMFLASRVPWEVDFARSKVAEANISVHVGHGSHRHGACRSTGALVMTQSDRLENPSSFFFMRRKREVEGLNLEE